MMIRMVDDHNFNIQTLLNLTASQRLNVCFNPSRRGRVELTEVNDSQRVSKLFFVHKKKQRSAILASDFP